MLTAPSSPPAPTSPARPARGWFRFSLRTLFIALTLFCVGGYWCFERCERQRKAIEAVQAAGGYAVFSAPFTADSERLRWRQYLFLSPEYVQFTDVPVSDRDLRPLLDLPRIKGVIVSGNSDQAALTDEAAETLSRIPTLVNLTLPRTSIGDRGAAALSKLRNLETLLLEESRIGDPGAKSLGRLQRLRVLALRNSQVGDEGLRELAPLPHLTGLSLSRNQVGDAGARALRGHRLESLDLSHTQISDAALPDLLPSATLKVLVLDGCRVTDSLASHDLARIKSLCLADTQITDRLLAELPGSNALQLLGLDGTQITADGWRHLAKFPKLVHLQANRVLLDDAALRQIARLSFVRHLSLVATPVTDAQLPLLHPLVGTNMFLPQEGVTPAAAAALQKVTGARRIELYPAAGN